MRRPVGLTLICLGAFFLTLAPLVRLYVAGQVVKVPLNQYRVTHLEARNATYFDTASLKTRKGVTLRAINTVRGDVRANGGNDDIAVWDSSTNIYDQANPDKPIQIQGYRIALDRSTAKLVNCCGVHVDGDTGVELAGYSLLFPLANVDKRDYPFFDMTTKQHVPMRFSGEDEVMGLDTYRFVQQVPNTKTAALDTKLPGKMLGLGEDSPAQAVDRYSQATITTWVDPRTGIPVKHSQKIHSTVQTRDGQGRMTVASAELVTVPASVRAGIETTNESAFQIALVRTYVPVGAVTAGLIMLVLGVMFGMLRGKPPKPEPRRPDGKFGDPSPPGGEPAPADPEPGTEPRKPDGRFGAGPGPKEPTFRRPAALPRRNKAGRP